MQSQLEQQKMGEKYPDILQEVPKVRRDLGYPPLVTPMSQIVGVQSLFNVITGQRYGVKSKEIKDYVKGLYGRPPTQLSPEIIEMIIEGEPITGRPADLLEPMLEKARQEIAEHIQQPEDVLTYVLFPEIAKKFFESRNA